MSRPIAVSTCPSSKERTTSHNGQTTPSRQCVGYHLRLFAIWPTVVGLLDMTVRRGRRFGGERKTDIMRQLASMEPCLSWTVEATARQGPEGVDVEQASNAAYAEVRRRCDACNAAGRVMRTFLDALERNIVACRELRGANWAGRSPLLGSIVRCRPKAVVELLVVLHPSFFSKMTLA